jgi:hypothetical protein
MAIAKLAEAMTINNKAYTNLQDLEPDVLASSARLVKLDSTYVGAGKLLKSGGGPGIPKALWVGTGGTMTGIDAYGNVITAFPLFQGLNPIMVSEITSLTTAASVWGLY